MIKAKNIANAPIAFFTLVVAKVRGFLFSPIGRVRGGLWVKLGLAAIILLLAVPCYVHAQNTPTAPYINSWQKYKVPFGDAGNTFVWQLSNPNYNGGNPITLTSALSWIKTGTEPTVSATDAFIEIKFVQSVFTSAGSIIAGGWTLLYEEHDAGSGNCIAVRSVVINPVENLFSVTARDDYEGCNNFSGKVWPNNIDIASAQDTTISFTVDMAKAESHRVKQWAFTGTITAVGTAYVSPTSLFTVLAGSTNRGYNYAIVWTSGNSFTLTVTVANPATEDYTTDNVTFSAHIKGPAINTADVTIAITSATAISGSAYDVSTDDNGLGNKDQTINLNPIPATSIISMVD